MNNISFDLPTALTKAASAGDLEARFVGVTGSETPMSIPLTIAPDGKVSGQMMVKPGKWTFEVQFFQYTKSGGDPVPVAFFRFDERDVAGEPLNLTYEAKDLKFDDPPPGPVVIEPSISPPNGCQKKYDCDGDGFSNFEEIKAGSDPFDPNSRPVKPLPPPPPQPPAIIVNLTDGQVVRDRVLIRADASSASGIKSLILVDPSVADENSSPEVFSSSWDTTTLADDSDISLTFEAEDTKGLKIKFVRKVRIDNVPNIKSFGTSVLIQSGQSATLSWEADNFTTLVMVNGTETIPQMGTKTVVSPGTTTIYELVATRQIPGGRSFSLSKKVTVTVNHNPVFVVEKHLTKKLGEDPGAGIKTSWEFTDSDVGDTVATTTQVYKGSGCAGTQVQTVKGTATTATLTGLDPRTDYSYTVGATDGVKGGSATSACFNFMTGDNGLVGWWRFDENRIEDNCSGNANKTTSDSSGKGNGATMKNTPCWKPGVSGSGMELNGDGPIEDYLTVAKSPLWPTGSNPFTVSLWVKFNTVGDVAFVGQSEGPGVARKWAFLYVSGSLAFHFFPCTTLTCEGRYLPNYQWAPQKDRWYHLSVTRENNLYSLFIDGLKVASAVNDESIPDVATSELNIGRVFEGVGKDYYYLKGTLDEFAIYNRALTTAEVRTSCRRNDPSTGPGLTPICAADDVPEQSTPGGSLKLPPTRAFVSWKQGAVPPLKTFDHYDLCYGTAGEDLTPALACLNPTSRKDPYFVLAHIKKPDGTLVYNSMGQLLANNTGYRWKVRTCYNAKGTDCSDYSPVWSFSTDNSLLGWWKFDDAPFQDDTSPPAWYPPPSCDNDPLTGLHILGALCDSSDPLGKRSLGIATGYDSPVEKAAARVLGNGGELGGDPAIVGNALRFDGVNDYVEVADSSSWAFGSSNFAIEVRVNFNSIKSPSSVYGPAVFLVASDEGGGDIPKWVFTLGGGALNFMLGSPTLGHPVIIQTLFSPNLHQWYHLAVGRSGNTWTLSINGSPAASVTKSWVVPDPAAPLRIGYAEGANYLDGLVDEVLINGAAFSSEAVKNNYCALEALAGGDLKAKGCL